VYGRNFGAGIATCRLTKFPLKYTQLFSGLQGVCTVNGLKLKKNCALRKAEVKVCSLPEGVFVKGWFVTPAQLVIPGWFVTPPQLVIPGWFVTPPQLVILQESSLAPGARFYFS
jgi:hypothetical protein